MLLYLFSFFHIKQKCEEFNYLIENYQSSYCKRKYWKPFLMLLKHNFIKNYDFGNGKQKLLF